MDFDLKEKYIEYIIKQINTTPYLVDNFLKKDGNKLHHREAFDSLKKHVDNFLQGNDENRYIIMPGLRGVGKSTLLMQIYEYLVSKGIGGDRILYIPVDETKSIPYSNINDIINVFVEDIHSSYPATLDKEIFLLIDETQEDSNWSNTGKVLYDQSKKIFMLFTGSNALNFEVSDNSSRRCLFERIYPLNFGEYLFLKYNIPKINITNDLMDLFLKGNIENASQKEKIFLTKQSNIKKPVFTEFKHFLSYGGFPFTFNIENIQAHNKLYKMVDKVVDKDFEHLKSIDKDTKNDIFSILTFISSQKPGGLSVNSLSKNLGISREKLTDLLENLEKTHLIFRVQVQGGAGKMIRSPSKYYFLSPALNASINFTIGKHNPENNDYMGMLAETYVASTFFRLKNIISKPNGLFTPLKDGMADFIITDGEGNKIAVEVGIGKKTKRQVEKTIRSYNCKYGVIVSSTTNLIKKEDNIIYLPLTTFALM